MTVAPIRGPGRPLKGYRLADDTRVPSVTTITGRFKDAGALIRWANKEGLEGRALYEKRDKAAEAGSVAHQWIEDTFHGDPLTEFPELADETREQACIGYGAFVAWQKHINPVVHETEMPLVSEKYRYGGTLDAVATCADELVLLDWKTSSGVYGEYIAQLAAYRQLLRERDGIDDAPKAAMLLRVGKEFADFHFHSYPESVLDMGWSWFIYARHMYDLDARLKKVAA